LGGQDQVRPGASEGDATHALQAVDTADPRRKALALGLEFAKRAVKAVNFDELCLLLTNDIRTVVQFDRSFLVVHLGGASTLAAVGNQPVVEKKSRFRQLAEELARSMKDVDQALLVSGKEGLANLPDTRVSGVARNVLEEYLDFSNSAHLLCVPLIDDNATVAHIFLEFFDTRPPDNISVVTLLNIAPFLSSAIVERWLKTRRPKLITLLHPEEKHKNLTSFLLRRVAVPLVLVIAGAIVFFAAPVPFYVGGEAEIVPTKRHVAFCKIEGLIDRVNVAEGAVVNRGEALATLDPKELEYKLKSAEKQFEVLTSEMLLLRAAAMEDQSKLAESKLVELKRESAWEDVNYFKWQLQFLAITAPVSGMILTKDVETLTGKKFRDGEPFCEIVEPGDLSVDVFVPQDRINFVQIGQDLTFFLDGDPRKGYSLRIGDIAPIAEAIARLGNIYRVRAPFPHPPKSAMVGMKGTGKVKAKEANLWFIVSLRLLERWRQWSILY
jgi:hypothetical protein